MSGTVVVGVEGTTSSRDALVWAARAAAARDAKLHVVHTVGHPAVAHDPAFETALAARGEKILHAEATRARSLAPTLPVRLTLAHGPVARVLTEESADAELLVVGGRDGSLAERVVVGSHGYQVAAGARCPVALVPHLAPPTATRVVVGVDGSPDSDVALDLAAAEAARRRGTLHVAHAWSEPAPLPARGHHDDGRYADRVAQAAETVVTQAVARVAAAHPDLRVERHLAHARPADLLLRLAGNAALLVVGSRGRQGFARLLLGSVSHAVVLHAPCPVVVARA